MADWRVKGCIIPVITPFQPTGEIDEKAMRRIVDFVIEEQAADGIIPCGTTGESPTLDYHEHLRVIEVVMEHTAGRVPVIAGTGSNSTAEAIEMTMAAEKLEWTEPSRSARTTTAPARKACSATSRR